MNAQDYYSWQIKDTMTFTTGNHTMKWGYEFIRPVFEFNLALLRQASFTGTRTGNAIADFMIGAFDQSTIEFGIADHSPSTVKHQAFIEDSWKMHPRLTLNYGLRYEPFIPFDQKGGRHTTWVPGVRSTVVTDAPTGILFPGDPGLPGRLTNSDLNNFAPRLGAAWDLTGDAKTVVRGGYGIFYQQINGETTHAAEGPWRGTTQLRQGRIEDPFGSLGQTEPPPESPGRFGCSPISSYPGLSCTQYPVPIRIVYTDQDLRTSYTHHFSVSLQRQLGRNLAVEGAYVGKLGRDLVGHNYFNAAPFINSPRTGLPPSAENIEERVPFSPGIISAQSRVLGNFFDSTYHSMQLRVDRRMARTFSFSASYALSSNRTNQPENTTGLISNIPNPFDLESLWGPSFLDRRHVFAGSWVWSPQHTFGNAIVGALLNGWTLTGFHRFQSGSPLVFTTGSDVAQNGILQPNGQYPLLVSVYHGRRSTPGSQQHLRHDRAVLQHRGIRSAQQHSAWDLRRRQARLDLRAGGQDQRLCAHALRQSWTGPARAAARRVLQCVQPGEFQRSQHAAFVCDVRTDHRRRRRSCHSAGGQSHLVRDTGS